MLKSIARTSDETVLHQPFADAHKLGWRSIIAVFGIAIVAAALHHCFETSVKTALLFDGRHYFESCQRMAALVIACGSLKIAAIVSAEQALRSWVMLDGPVLPALFGSVFALIGHIPASSDWTVIVAVQTILHSIAATFVCLLGFKLTGNRAVAIICGIAWGLYPAAIIASGRLMTESLAVLLLLALPLSLAAALKHTRAAIVAGIVCGLLILLKPGMIPSVVLSAIACLLLSPKRLQLFLTLALAAGLTVTPWLLYTHQTTGKAAITVQRMPVHNALIGWDPETGGWQTNPPSGFERVMNTGGEPLSVIGGIWLSHPVECLNLLIDKVGHLFSTPWNDYRCRLFGMDQSLQGALHYTLLFGGLFGFVSWILLDLRKDKEASSTGILCAAAASGQLVYLMFEPVCRYAFPLIAFAAVFAAVGLANLAQKTAQRTDRTLLAVAAGIALCAISLVAFSAYLCEHRLAETTYRLAAGDEAVKTTKFKTELSNNFDTALVLIDGDKALEGASIEVNGFRCTGPVLPFNYYDPSRYQSFTLMKELAYGMNITVDDFRQWRAIQVPLQAVAKRSEVSVKIIPAAATTIYGDNDASRLFLSPDFLCVNRLINSKTSLEMRNYSASLSGQCLQRSVIKNAREARTLAGSLRVKLLLASKFDTAANSKPDLTLGRAPVMPSQIADRAVARLANPSSANKDNQSMSIALAKTLTRPLTQADFDPLLRGPNNSILISKSILKSARTTAATVQLSELGPAETISIKLTGELKSGTRPGSAGVVIETENDEKTSSLIGRLPPSIRATPDWQPFAISDLVTLTADHKRIKSVRIAFFPGPWQQVAGYGCDKSCGDFAFRNLQLEVKAAPLATLAGKQLRYF